MVETWKYDVSFTSNLSASLINLYAILVVVIAYHSPSVKLSIFRIQRGLRRVLPYMNCYFLIKFIYLCSTVDVNWACQQTSEGSSNWPMDQSLHSHTEYNVTTKFPEGVDATDLLKSLGPFLMDSDEQNDLQFHLSNADTISRRNDSIEGKADHAPAIKPLLDGSFGDGLKKLDSFNRWMSKELEDVDEPQMQSSSGAYWDTVESENEVDESSVPLQVRLDSYMLGPSLSHDQLFSIVDFSPNWAYENSEIKVF